MRKSRDMKGKGGRGRRGNKREFRKKKRGKKRKGEYNMVGGRMIRKKTMEVRENKKK